MSLTRNLTKNLTRSIIRPISEFEPTAFSGNVFWLDAADDTTITESGGLVSQWDDKSGEGNNVTQGTSTKQPTTNATTQNSLNIIDLDGGDELDYPSALYTIPNGDNTQFFILKRSTEDAAAEYFSTFVEGGVSNRQLIFFDATAGSVTFRNNGLTAITSTGNTNTDMQIIAVRRNGTTQGISVNGETEITAANAGSGTPVDNAALGSVVGGGYLTGSIAEVIMYNRSLSTSEISQVNNYLSTKWNITLT